MSLVRTVRERDVITVGDVTLSIAYIRGSIARIAIDAPADQKISFGDRLPGAHHGHGGERLDDKGNPRYGGPRPIRRNV